MESRQILPKLHRVCCDLHRIPFPDDIPNKVVGMVAELAGVPYAEMWLRHEDTDSIRLASVNDDTYLSEDVPTSMLTGQCVVGEIISSGTLRVCPDLLKVPSWSRKEWSSRNGIISLLGVPLITENKVIGAICIMGRNRSQLGPMELQVLQFLADQTAVAFLRKQAEAALKDFDDRNRIFFDSVLDAVITMDAECRITGWNAQAESTFGWSREETIGRNIYDAIIPPSNREEYKLWLGHLMDADGERNSNTRIDIMVLHQDGTEIPVELKVTPVRAGTDITYAVMLKDIRERKEAAEKLNAVNGQLRETERNLSSIVDIAPDPIISTNENGEVVMFSKSAETLLGYKCDDIIGNSVVGLYETDNWAEEVLNVMREKGGSISDYETTLRSKDGNLIPVSITASILYDDEGTEAGTVGFQKDLRKTKKMEKELQEAHEELHAAKGALEAAQASVVASEKLAALGRLTAGVSHEILNPLNIITLRLHMMIKDPEVQPQFARHLRVLDDQASRISKIAQDLLYFARQREPERRPLNLNGVVKRTLGLLEHDFRQSNITLDLRLTSGLPTVKADEDQLQQVVLNLLTNARDAMPQGGTLKLSTYEIQDEMKRFVKLRVEDSGAGIEAGNLDKIFDPFFTTKAEGEGTGLGLAICKGIIESHGGSIWAEPGERGGASFVISLGLE